MEVTLLRCFKEKKKKNAEFELVPFNIGGFNLLSQSFQISLKIMNITENISLNGIPAKHLSVEFPPH